MIGTLILKFVVQFLVAVFATLGFAIVFNAPFKELHLCGITGAIGWLVFYALLYHTSMHSIASSLIATFVLTLFARSFAVYRQHPVTVYLLPGIFPLVPGAGIYYTAYYLIDGNQALFAQKGTETLEIALAIVFGIIFGSAIPQLLFNKLFTKKTPVS